MTTPPWELAIASAGLPGRPRHALPDRPLEGTEWDDLLGGAQQIGMIGLLDRLIGEEVLPADEPQATAAEALARQAARNGARLDRLLVEVVRHLDGAGIDHRVLKGAATAHLDHDDPSDRLYGDIDLLVPGAAMDLATRTLGAAGFRRDLPERRAGFDARFGKEIPLARAGIDGVDLHRVLALGGFGLALPVDRLWDRSDTYRVGAATARALDAEGRLLHACVTTELGDERPRLNALRDVALLSWRPLDPGRLLDLAPPGRGFAVVAAAVSRARRELGEVIGPPVLDLVARHEPSPWERRLLRTYRAHGGSNTTELLGGLLGLPTWADRFAYAAALLRPTPTYRRARRRTGRSREWRSALGDLRRAPGRRS